MVINCLQDRLFTLDGMRAAERKLVQAQRKLELAEEKLGDFGMERDIAMRKAHNGLERAEWNVRLRKAATLIWHVAAKRASSCGSPKSSLRSRIM